VKRRRKRTPEEEAAYREFRRQSDENLRKAREIIARAWADLEERREREQPAGS
jgi:hypothetical protein